MRVLATVLVLVITMHSQCLNACPVALYLSAVSGQPPCHHHGSPQDSSQDSANHEIAGCGLGLAVQSQIAGKFKTQCHAASVYVIPDLVGVCNPIEWSPRAASFSPTGNYLHLSPPSKSVLRI